MGHKGHSEKIWAVGREKRENSERIVRKMRTSTAVFKMNIYFSYKKYLYKKNNKMCCYYYYSITPISAST